MARLLVLGDPVVSLGAETLIPDGGLVIEDAAIVAAGPREARAALGPFERVLGSGGHFVVPGFVNCHYHSELAMASNNPGSNLRLSTGICRVRDIMDAGGRVAFGTDGISFSDRDDFFTELRLACYLQRLPREFGQGRLDSEQVLRAAAGNGARALGLAGRLGSLEPGRYADLLIVRKDRIFFPPGRYDGEPFLDVVLDRAESGDIDTVMAAGRVLMEGGRVTVVDEAQVRDRFAEAVADRVYRPSAEVRRWAELGARVEPYLPGFYRPWYETPIEPAYVCNPRTPPAAPGRPPPPPP